MFRKVKEILENIVCFLSEEFFMYYWIPCEIALIMIIALVFINHENANNYQNQKDSQEIIIKQLDEINQRLNQLASTNMQPNELQREE